MAKNWTVGEAVQAIHEGNPEAIIDLGKRFPLFSVNAAPGNEQGLIKLLCSLPAGVTARKVEMVLKGDVPAGESEGEEQEAPSKAPKAKDKEEDTPEYEGSPKELFELCKKRKIKVEPKQKAEVYIKALKKDDAEKAKAAAAKAKAKEEEADEDDDWDDEEEEKPAKSNKGKNKPKDEDEDDDWDI